MRVQSIAIISALATLSLANAASAAEPHKTDQGVWIRLGLGGRPTVNVTLGDFSESQKISLRTWNPEMKLEWTANGQPMPTPLPSPNAQCITIEAQAYSCEALTHWFKGPSASGRPGRNFARAGYPEGFLITNMELDTEYCFRFWIAWPLDPRREWSNWSCARTPLPPPPPPRPFAPSAPVLTLLPAVSGAGIIGGDQPWRILVEWQPNPSNNSIAQESVLIFQGGDWEPTDGESRPGEKIVVLPQHYDPGAVYAFRVCAKNVSGEACSPLTRTLGRPYLETVPAEGKASRFPVPDASDISAASDTYDPDTPVAAQPGTMRAQRRIPGGSPSTLSKCEAAQMARARNSPAAPGLEAQCREEQRVIGLAPRGEILAGQDPLATALRDQQPNDSARRGFDIGMAVAEGHTAPGPGKQATHDGLPIAEQRGFAIAVAFSLERNKNAALATTGARIATQDPAVGAARNSGIDPFYRLGFDIGTGYGVTGGSIFESQAIRNGLGEASRRGFDDAIQFRLGGR